MFPIASGNLMADKIDLIVEILIWLIIAVTIFYICNVIIHLRTAASLFLGFLITSVITFFFFTSIFSEIAIMFSIVVGAFYAISRATRDYRNDTPPK
jgi:hypothetical protein